MCSTVGDPMAEICTEAGGVSEIEEILGPGAVSKLASQKNSSRSARFTAARRDGSDGSECAAASNAIVAN